MSYVTVAWSLVASCALLLSLMYGFVWLMDRKSRASLAFAVFALGVVGVVIVELGMMYATTPQEWGEWVHAIQVPSLVLLTGLVFFVRLHFKAGRQWLMWLVIAMRGVIVVKNFASTPNFNFARIDSIERIRFLGEDVTVIGNAQVSSWQWFATLSFLFVLVYLVDACVTLWRTGSRESRRTATHIGIATILSALFAFTYVQLTIWNHVQLPALISPPFLILLGAMAFEKSRDTLRAMRLTRELRDSEARLEIAAAAAGLGIWTWDAVRARMWATGGAREMFGLRADEPIDIAGMVAMIQPDEVTRIESVWRNAAARGTEEEVQFEITLPDGAKRWLLARGRSEADSRGMLTSIKGVLRDVTEQFRAREEIEELRRDLAHAGRVSVLGTLSSSLAHELSQPLGAILLNTEAGMLLLQRPNPDLEEIRLILADIHRDDHRAAEVIDRLRKLLKHRKLDLAPVSIDGLLQDLASLLKSDAIARNVTLENSSEAGLPPVRGDRVHLSQVLINLVMNAMDAVAELPPARRQVTVRARVSSPGWLEISVTDSGAGVPVEIAKKIFDPFFTTKPTGMGMGLSVSRTIVESHSGRLWAENGVGGGATFLVALPAVD